MKKTTLLITILFLLSLALSACGGANTASESSAEASGTPMPGAGLSDSMHLLLGILSLGDSEAPLSAEQATAMLPLWKAVRSLGESDTAAQAEIEALYTQVRGTLSEEQLELIDGMQFSMESMNSLAAELGLDMQFAGGGRGDMTPEMQATMQALRESGQMPQFEEGAEPPEGFEFRSDGEIPEGAPRFDVQGGDMPSGGVVIEGGPGMGGGGGGQFFGDTTGLTPEQIATAQASGANLPGLTNTISSVWLEALISMLEAIVAGE